MAMNTLTTQDVQDFIDGQELSARLIRDIGHTPTVPDAAEALGVHPDQIIKTLLFLVRTDTSPAGEPEAVVVISNGTNRVDKKALAAYYGVGKKRVRLAPPDVVVDLLGYPAGGVPPFGHRTTVPVLMDSSIVELQDRFDDRIYAGGGDDVTMMELTVTELERVLSPAVVNLSEA